MTTPRPRPPILDDDWEPPPRPRSIRMPVVLVASVVVIAGAAVVTIRAGVWEPAPAQTLPLPDKKSHSLWYPDDSAASIWSRSQIAPAAVDSDPAPPPAPVPVPAPRRARAVAPRPALRVPSVPGYLFINSTPWAELSVDGRVVGNTPQLNIRVAPGRHQLVFTHDGFAPLRTTVIVGPGATVKITGVVLPRIAP